MLKFAGIEFRGLSLGDLFGESSRLIHVVTVNAEYIVRANENERLRRIVNGGVATFDGQVPFLVARWLNQRRRFSRIAGSDLIYHICERAARDCERVFLLGGAEGSNSQSVAVLRQRYPGLIIDGYSPPHVPYPFSAEHETLILDRLRQFRPHYVLVGFGAGKQDYWIDDHRAALMSMGVKLAAGVGGVFEMVSGRIKRAPVILQVLGMEGVYRLVKEPKLFRLQRLVLSLRFFRYVWASSRNAAG